MRWDLQDRVALRYPEIPYGLAYTALLLDLDTHNTITGMRTSWF